jgi:nucleoside-diphosphate-sugar epimerase
MNVHKPTLVITGASGFVGSKLALTAVNLGFKVIGIDISESVYKTPPYESHKIDISKNDFSNLIPNNSTFVHLASISTDSGCRDNPQLALDVNYSGTLNAIKSANKAGSNHFIFASSEWVYPETEVAVDQTENDQLNLENLNSFYAISKLVGENIVRTQFKKSFTNLRFGIVYGPRSIPGSSLESLAFKVKNNEEIKVGSKFTARRFIYIDDLISGLIACSIVDENSIVNGPLNLAGNKLISLDEIVETTSVILGKKSIIMSESKPASIRNPISEKAKSILNWNPEVDLRKGIELCLK